MYDKLLFELSHSRIEKNYFSSEVPVINPEDVLPAELVRKDPIGLPELSEGEVVRHFISLSAKNHHVDKAMYPLGSCTMKYNPKVNETIAAKEEFVSIHPDQPNEMIQGAMEIMYRLQNLLLEITGLDDITLQPAAGAHGEFAGLKMIRNYHKVKGNLHKNKILIPDSAHGTNPASVAISGMIAETIPSDENGFIDMNVFLEKLDDTVAGIMITNPSTLGIFEKNFKVIADHIHEKDGLVYMDGANLNALLGIVKPGDLGVDALHINLHKTFSTPHGGGGPGAGPVAVSGKLKDFLPVPVVRKNEQNEFYFSFDVPHTIGRLHPFYGNFGMILRAYVYILTQGREGLKEVSKQAIINANYLLKKIGQLFELPYKTTPMHEFVLSGENLKQYGFKTLDLAKRMLDYGVHAPTVYFPLIVKESIMIEPTETESKQMLDAFAEIMERIIEDMKNNPDTVKNAPLTTPVRRLNEVKANKELKIMD
ncbi:MAG: aminomethyl-transferring glycine dehydrogenase subunit GcvPB [Calditrichia bacterium]